MTNVLSNKDMKLNGIIGISLTLIMVVAVREACVIVCQLFDVERAANIVGLVVMFIILFSWRLLRERQQKSSLPNWLTTASNRLLMDSGFAFLPVSAGAGLLLFGLGNQFWSVIAVIIISTIPVLWAIAKLADFWLKSIDKDDLPSTEILANNNLTNQPSGNPSISNNSISNKEGEF